MTATFQTTAGVKRHRVTQSEEDESQEETNNIWNDAFSDGEMAKAAKSLKKSKAPAKDKMIAEFYANLAEPARIE